MTNNTLTCGYLEEGNLNEEKLSWRQRILIEMVKMRKIVSIIRTGRTRKHMIHLSYKIPSSMNMAKNTLNWGIELQ